MRKTLISVREKEKIVLASQESRRVSAIFIIVLGILFIFSTGFTRFNPVAALLAQGEFWNFIITDFFPPRMISWNALLDSLLQTFYMAMSATGIASLISFILSFLGTKTITRSAAVNNTIRGFASILRNIPGIVWAFILVAAFGIGTAVGVLALVISNTGTLTRYFVETLDETAEETMEGPVAAGASMPPVIFQAVIPTVLPTFIAWMLYSIELNIRASTILGMVGAGGIGLMMMGYIKRFNYSAATTCIIAVSIMIIAVNILTEKIRKAILR